MHKALCTVLALAACQSTPSTETQLAYLRAIGDAVIRVDGTAAILRYAPDVLPLIDVAPKDGVVTFAEIEALVVATQDPAQLTWLIILARELVTKKS